MKKNFLIISPVAKNDYCYKEWIKGDRHFDLMMVNYGDEDSMLKEDADYYFEAKGFKLEITKDAIDAFSDLVRTYAAVWLLDDDIFVSTEEINQLFKIFHDYDLDLAQPGIINKYRSHAITKRNIMYILRYVNYVEMMCPLFKTETLFGILDIFKMTRSGWGIDWLWSKMLESKRIAIIDAVGVIHKKKTQTGGLLSKIAGYRN